METSFRYNRDSKSLRIHAKEKFPLGSNTFLQAHAELDTDSGSPSYLAALIRTFYPELSASVGVGTQFNKYDKFRYNIRAKKAFPASSDRLLTFNIKGRFYIDKEFNEIKATGGLEVSRATLNFQKRSRSAVEIWL